MKLKNPVEFTIWQTIQAYKGEAVNKKYAFTHAQELELLTLADIAEANHTSISGTAMGKMYNALKQFDKLFVEYGGDLDALCDKVDEITSSVNPKFKKAGDTIMNTKGALSRLSKMNFRRTKS